MDNKDGFFKREKELEYIDEVKRLSAQMIEQVMKSDYYGAWRCSLQIKKIVVILMKNKKLQQSHYKKLRSEVRNKNFAKVYKRYLAELKALK